MVSAAWSWGARKYKDNPRGYWGHKSRTRHCLSSQDPPNLTVLRRSCDSRIISTSSFNYLLNPLRLYFKYLKQRTEVYKGNLWDKFSIMVEDYTMRAWHVHCSGSISEESKIPKRKNFPSKLLYNHSRHIRRNKPSQELLMPHYSEVAMSGTVFWDSCKRLGRNQHLRLGSYVDLGVNPTAVLGRLALGRNPAAFVRSSSLQNPLTPLGTVGSQSWVRCIDRAKSPS